MTIDTPRLLACTLLALGACVQTKLIGETTPEDSSSTGDASSETTSPTTTTTPTGEPTSEPTTTEIPDGSTSDTGTDESTDGGFVGEWTGTYGTGFGNVYFTPCGEEESLYVAGGEIPGFEICDADIDGEQIWIRVSGTRMGGEFGPVLHDAVLLEGPCLVGSCEPEAAFGECSDFESLCFPPEPQCDPYSQDCQEGSKCSVVDEPEVFVCVADGVVEDGEACTRTDARDDCAAGLLCVTRVVGEDGTGTCAQLCADVSHCDGAGDECTLNDGGWGVCTTP